MITVRLLYRLLSGLVIVPACGFIVIRLHSISLCIDYIHSVEYKGKKGNSGKFFQSDCVVFQKNQVHKSG